MGSTFQPRQVLPAQLIARKMLRFMELSTGELGGEGGI